MCPDNRKSENIRGFAIGQRCTTFDPVRNAIKVLILLFCFHEIALGGGGGGKHLIGCHLWLDLSLCRTRVFYICVALCSIAVMQDVKQATLRA